MGVFLRVNQNNLNDSGEDKRATSRKLLRFITEVASSSKQLYQSPSFCKGTSIKFFTLAKR